MFFLDDACIPELRTRSEIHPFYPRRQGHAVLGRVVRNSPNGQLRGDMSSDLHIALRGSSHSCFLPLPETALFHVLIAFYNLQLFNLYKECLSICKTTNKYVFTDKHTHPWCYKSCRIEGLRKTFSFLKMYI